MSFPTRPPASVAHAGPDAPLYGATPGQAFVRFWRRYAVFSGRASRSEYWWWVLVSTVVSAVLQLVAAAVSDGGFVDYFVANRTFSSQALLPWLWSVAVLVPGLAVAVRRLHDTDRSGWWQLLSLPSLAALAVQVTTLGPLGRPPELDGADVGRLALILIPLLALSAIGTACSIALIVLLASAPDPRGARFDRARRSPPG